MLKENRSCEGGLKEEIDLEKMLRETPNSARLLAKKYIKQFFSEERFHSGGKIPESVLFSERYINLVLELNSCDGVDRAYKLLASSRESTPRLIPEELEARRDIEECSAERPDDEPDVEDSLLPADIQLVLGLIHRCARRRIPQPFVAGIFCIYIEVCAGISLYRFIDD